MEKADTKLANTEDDSRPKPLLVETETESADQCALLSSDQPHINGQSSDTSELTRPSVSNLNEADKRGEAKVGELKSLVAKEKTGLPSSNENDLTLFQNIKLFFDSERFKVAALITAVVLLGGCVVSAAKKYEELHCNEYAAVFSKVFCTVTGTTYSAVGRPDLHYALLPLYVGGDAPRDIPKSSFELCGQIQGDFISRVRFDGTEADLTKVSRSFAFLLTNEDSKAEKTVNECVIKHPRCALLYQLHSFTLAALLRFPEAYAELDRARAIDDTSGLLDAELDLLMVQGRYAEVLHKTGSNSFIPLLSPCSSLSRMEALMRLGRLEDALAMGKTDPERFKSLTAFCYALQGNYKAAQELADILSKVRNHQHDETIVDEAHLLQSKIACHKGNYQQALKELNIATKAASSRDQVVYRMFLLNKLGKYSESLECDNKLAGKSFIVRELARYYCQLAIAQLHTGDFSKALSSAEKSIKINEHLKAGYDVARLAATQTGDKAKVARFETKLKEGKLEDDLNGL